MATQDVIPCHRNSPYPCAFTLAKFDSTAKGGGEREARDETGNHILCCGRNCAGRSDDRASPIHHGHGGVSSSPKRVQKLRGTASMVLRNAHRIAVVRVARDAPTHPPSSVIARQRIFA